jgi:hypothetical protein
MEIEAFRMSEYELLAEIRDSHPATTWPTTTALQRSFQTLLDATDELRAQANAAAKRKAAAKAKREAAKAAGTRNARPDSSLL